MKIYKLIKEITASLKDYVGNDVYCKISDAVYDRCDKLTADAHNSICFRVANNLERI